MTRKRFHGLKKVKVRATWNKYNLYNLSRLKRQNVMGPTYFQQKWAAKSMTRAYHGEHIREKQWKQLFTPRLPGVIQMDPKKLAESDGSEFAAGRGSGREESKESMDRVHAAPPVPYMHMTYAPMERRLDMAVWRALFASSARQARQFVIHGMVKVNGKKMPYPGYLLNPGDMFQVDVDSVLYATGAPKPMDQVKAGRKLHKARRRLRVVMAPAKKKSRPAAGLSTPATEGQSTPGAAVDIEEVRKQRRLDMKQILEQVEVDLADKRSKVGAKRKIAIRALVRDVRKAMSSVNRKTAKELDDILATLLSQLALTQRGATATPSSGEEGAEPTPTTPTLEEQKALREAITRARENPIDDSKPYATPWRPRPYMSAFAFIPRYLEVNHNICSAVYVRHPVARNGVADVPSPFDGTTQQLAFNWYLRSGR